MSKMSNKENVHWVICQSVKSVKKTAEFTKTWTKFYNARENIKKNMEKPSKIQKMDCAEEAAAVSTSNGM